MLSEKTSESTTLILPIPALTSPSSTYPPTAPHPHRMTDVDPSLRTPSSPTSRLVLVLMSSMYEPPEVFIHEFTEVGRFHVQ